MARVMDLSAFGTTSTALAALNIIVVPAALGYDTASVRYIALARSDPPQLRSLTSYIARSVSLSCLVVCVSLLAVAVVELFIGQDEAATALLVLMLIIPTFAFIRVGEGWLRGFGRLVPAMIGSAVVVPVLTIAMLLLVWALTSQSLNAEWALGARATASALGFLLIAALVWSRLRDRPDKIDRLTEIDHTAVRNASFVLCGVSFLAMVLTQVDIVAVAFFSGSEEAGLYSAAVRVALAMNVALVAVNFVLAPKVARLHALDNRKELADEIGSAASWSLILMGAGCLVLFAIAPLVLRIFGPDFEVAADTLRILLVGQLVNGLCGPAAALLNMTGRQVATAAILGSAALLDLVLLSLLIPPLGMNGAAIATASATAWWNLGMAFYARRSLGVWPLPTPLARILP